MNKWLKDLPSTNFRIAVTMLLAFLTALALALAGAAGREVDEGVLGLWLGFLAVMAGVDYLQFAKKRETHMETPPARPDVEDAQAREP